MLNDDMQIEMSNCSKNFASEMAKLNVDAVIVVTTPAAIAVRNQTKANPIIHPAALIQSVRV